MQVLNDRVLIRRFDEAEVTKGGIIIPDTYREKPMSGEIVSVGKGRWTVMGKQIPLSVKVGDKILFAKYSGMDVKLGGGDYLVLKEDDIIGVI